MLRKAPMPSNSAISNKPIDKAERYLTSLTRKQTPRTESRKSQITVAGGRDGTRKTIVEERMR